MLDVLLGQAPQVFGKLVWIASFRLGNSAVYRGSAFEGGAVTAEMANEALRQAHEGVFAQWIGLKLEQQYKDLAEYLSGIGRHTVFLAQGLEPLIPLNARDAERELFLADLEVVFSLAEAYAGLKAA
jgi:hypothetical protein